MKTIILYTLILFFIGCGGSASSENSNIKDNKIKNTKSVFNMPNLKDANNPIDDINHLK